MSTFNSFFQISNALLDGLHFNLDDLFLDDDEDIVYSAKDVLINVEE